MEMTEKMETATITTNNNTSTVFLPVENRIPGARPHRPNSQPTFTLGDVQNRRWRYSQDLATSLAELPLVYHLAEFVVSLFGSWTLFGLVWWALAAAYGDLGMEDATEEERSNMCTHAVFDFTSALLFSAETQTTLGYGTRVPNPDCAASMSLLVIQLVVGAAIDCIIAGLVFDRLSRQPGRAAALRFGRRAVVCRRDGLPCLAFRVWYGGRSPLLGVSVKAVLLRTTRLSVDSDAAKVSANADQLPQSAGLRLESPAGSSSCPLFAWPETIVHVIDSSIPLRDVIDLDGEMHLEQFEILVVVEGTVESTGVDCQFVRSYSETDILHGHVFVPLDVRVVEGDQLRRRGCCGLGAESRRTVCVDCSAFDDTLEQFVMLTENGEDLTSIQQQNNSK